MTADEIRARIVAALFLETEAGDWWLEEAVRRLEVYQSRVLHKRIYDVSTVGARIRTAREIVGLTQHQLAARIGAHPWRVSDWERGNQDLPIKHLLGLCYALGVRREWLLGDSDEGGPPMPNGIIRKATIPNWSHRSRMQQKKDRAKAELERLRGLRAPKKTSG